MLDLLRDFKHLIVSAPTFKEKIKSILFVLIILTFGNGIFLIIYSLEYNKSSDYIIIGILLTIPFFILYIYFYVLELWKNADNDDKILLLKKNGDQVIVKLDNNKITLFEKELGNRCVVDFEFTYKNKKWNYPYLSDRSPESLRVNLLVKKEAILYINPLNNDERFLDLDFLNQ